MRVSLRLPYQDNNTIAEKAVKLEWNVLHPAANGTKLALGRLDLRNATNTTNAVGGNEQGKEGEEGEELHLSR